MADLTVLSSVERFPLYPTLSRPQFTTFDSQASSSRLSLPLQGSDTNLPKMRPTLSNLDLRNSARRTRRRRSDDLEDVDGDKEDEDTSTATDSPTSMFQEEQSTPSSSPYSLFASASSPETIKFERRMSPPSSLVAPTLVSGFTSQPMRPYHRPTRSRSAPPERIRFDSAERRAIPSTPVPASTFRRHPTSLYDDDFHSLPTQSRARGYSSFGPMTPLTATSWSDGSQTRGGQLLRPPPPLHRPTTFWRRTPRSGVTGSSYSPSSHLIRRSTFVAAGLAFDKPMCDLSALGVESRVANHEKVQVRELFWEVIA